MVLMYYKLVKNLSSREVVKLELMKASEIKRFDNWTVLIYSEPGKGKTTMVKALSGKTLLLSIDGMYHVLSGVKHVDVLVMNPKKVHDELGNFYKFARKHLDDYDNFVIDNLSTFQKFWLNARGVDTKNGTPELRDYSIIDRIMLDFISSMKELKKNLLLFAHEKKVEVTMESGRVYTQFQPDIRATDAIMGIIPVVGRLVIQKDEETGKRSRQIILQPTQVTRAKDQLIGNIKTIEQMALLPKLQEENGE